MEPDGLRVRPEDVAALNRALLRGSAVVARMVGTGLLVIGAVGAVLWLWIMLRQQQVFGNDEGPFGFGRDGSISLEDRVDVLAATFSYLAGVALTAGAGLGLRLAGQYLSASMGDSLTRRRLSRFLRDRAPPLGRYREETVRATWRGAAGAGPGGW